LGKYYSRNDGNLYIYVTNGDSLIDLNYFPSNLNLFNAESAWRINDSMAIVNDADETNLDKAEIILSLNSYKRWNHTTETLEQYYISGDSEIFEEKIEVDEIIPILVKDKRDLEKEVIIPKAQPPGLPRSEKFVAHHNEEVYVNTPDYPLGKPEGIIDVLDDGFKDGIIDRMISRGLVFQEQLKPSSVMSQLQRETMSPQNMAFNELCEILVTILKKDEGDMHKEGIISSLNELVRVLTSYIRSHTPPLKSEKSPATELIDALTDYLKDRTPTETEEAPEKEDPLTKLIELLRKQGEGKVGVISKRPQVKEGGLVAKHPSANRLQGIMAEEVSNMYTHMAYLILEREESMRRAGWLNHIGDHWMELEQVLNLIFEEPHHTLIERKSIEGIKPGLSKAIFDEFLLRKSEIDDNYSEVRELLKEIPVNVLEDGFVKNYNTFENKILKAHLQGLLSKLDDVSEMSADIEGLLNRAMKFSEGSSIAIMANKLTKNQEAITEIEGLKGKIQGFLETTAFLDEVEVAQELPLETDVLTSHPNYSRFYSLKKSYDVNTPPPLFNIRASLPEIGESPNLYERWCEVEIVRSFMRIGFQLDEASTHLLDGNRGFVDTDEMRVVLMKGTITIRLTISQNVSGIDRVLDLEVADFTGRKSRYAFKPVSDTTPAQLETSIQELRRLEGLYNLVTVVHQFEVEPSFNEKVYAVSLIPGGSKRSFRALLKALLSEH